MLPDFDDAGALPEAGVELEDESFAGLASPPLPDEPDEPEEFDEPEEPEGEAAGVAELDEDRLSLR